MPGTSAASSSAAAQSAAAKTTKWEPDAKTLALVTRKRSFRASCEAFPYFEDASGGSSSPPRIPFRLRFALPTRAVWPSLFSISWP